MSHDFYINLNLRELNACQRVSAQAECAYKFFKRNIDFATGKATATFTPYRLGKLWNRPAQGQGFPKETITTKRVHGILAQLQKIGLLCFDANTLEFVLPLHDKTPKNEQPGNQSGNQPRNQSRHQSGNHSGHQLGSPQTRMDTGLEADPKNSGNQSGHQSGNYSGNYSGHQSGNHSGHNVTPLHTPSGTPINTISYRPQPQPPENKQPENPTATDSPPSVGFTDCAAFGLAETVATLPVSPPTPRKRGEIHMEGRPEASRPQELTAPWFAAYLSTRGFQYAKNPQSQPYYSQWERLAQRGELNLPLFKQAVVYLQTSSQATPTPKDLDQWIAQALTPKRRTAPPMGEMVL